MAMYSVNQGKLNLICKAFWVSLINKVQKPLYSILQSSEIYEFTNKWFIGLENKISKNFL